MQMSVHIKKIRLPIKAFKKYLTNLHVVTFSRFYLCIKFTTTHTHTHTYYRHYRFVKYFYCCLINSILHTQLIEDCGKYCAHIKIIINKKLQKVNEK